MLTFVKVFPISIKEKLVKVSIKILFTGNRKGANNDTNARTGKRTHTQ